jgi:excisionase family DNA binding protein
MTRKEAAEFLRVKERTVDAFVRSGKLPRYRRHSHPAVPDRGRA